MAGKTTTSNIVINAKANGFKQAAAEFGRIGSAMREISDQAEQFLRDSTETYRGYEDNMLTVEAVLGSTEKSASKLSREMQNLDKAAQNWAASTIFTTSDVSAAMVDAARAGWSYEQMMTGIPNVMHMAQAAGMDLASAMSYFIPVMNATGTGFEDGALLIDKWVMAANSAPTTVSEIGEAIQNLGGVSRLFASDNEMFTVLDLLAGSGVKGSNAGTAIRNLMSRIYAPTKKAGDELEKLGIDFSEILEDGEDIGNVAEALENIGLEAYDANGKMRPVLDVFQEMALRLNGKSEKEVNEFLKTVFGTKQYANALLLINAINGGYKDLYGNIAGAAGSAEEAGDVMTSGLTGAITRLESKWEEFQLQVGEKFAPVVEGVAGAIGGLVDTLNSADPTVVSAITGGLTALASIAPAMLAAEGAYKLVETLGVYGGSIVIAATAIGAMVGYAHELQAEYDRGLFGDVKLDSKSIQTYLDSQQTYYSFLQSMMADSDKAVADSAESMVENVGYLNEKMLTYVISGANLSGEQIEELKGIGEAIAQNVQDGVANAKISSGQFFNAMFGADSVEGAMVDQWLTSLGDEAKGIGEELRRQMTAALEDGELDENEQRAIQATVQRLAAIEAQIQAQMSEAEYYAMVKKAQGVSLDSAGAFLNDLDSQQMAELANVDDMFAKQYGFLRAAYEAGGEFLWNGKTVSAADINWAELESDFNAQWDAAKNSTRSKYGDATMAVLSQLLNTSGLGLNAKAYEMLGAEALGTPLGNTMRIIGPMVDEYIKASGGIDALRELYGSGTLSDSSRSMLGAILGFYDNREMARSVWNKYGGDAMMWDQMMSELGATSTDGGKSYVDGAAAGSEYVRTFQEKLDLAGFHATVTLGTIWDAPANAGYGSRTAGGGIFGSDRDLTAAQVYAEGGRATQASIFGEAGAEWAIPEEHSQRTADLLDAARAASGFTWDELIQRNGGLNAGGGSRVVLNYSPTVNANDAGEVETVLQRDKKNLRRMLEQMLEEHNIGGSEAYV